MLDEKQMTNAIVTLNFLFIRDILFRVLIRFIWSSLPPAEMKSSRLYCVLLRAAHRRAQAEAGLYYRTLRSSEGKVLIVLPYSLYVIL